MSEIYAAAWPYVGGVETLKEEQILKLKNPEAKFRLLSFVFLLMNH